MKDETRRRCDPRLLGALIAAPMLLSATLASAQAPRPQPKMTVQRSGETPSAPGGSANFTGVVRRDGGFTAMAPGRLVGGSNTFEPGARTFWHTHEFGQTMIVMSGVGLTQVEGEAAVLMRPGDIFTVAPGVRHWHGATATSAMVHLVVTEANAQGVPVNWAEPVAEEAYRAADREARAAR